MRSVNKVFKVTETRSIEIQKIATTETLDTIYENNSQKYVELTVQSKDDKGDVLNVESFKISGANYDLLMSEKPSFSPNKFANEWSKQDLWYFVDLLRSN